jgi:Xaa-Pro aminopeptidase
VDALLVTSLPNVRYLTGFTGSNGQAVIGMDAAVFLTDGRYAEQSRQETSDLERVTYLDGLVPSLRNVCSSLHVARLGFEAADVRYGFWRELSEALDGVELQPVEREVDRLRWEKDADEIRMLERAQEASDAAFDAILDRLAVGVTERQVARMLDESIHLAGADGLAFTPIVAFGENAAEPHHRPGHRPLSEGDVVKLDFGALSGGYHADMTRTISFGDAPPQLRKIHDIVREAQQAGIDAARAGARGVDVDATARAVIDEAGYGPAFSHGLGHGVGLEIHEGPTLGRRSDDVLPAGAVVTIEPGVYVPGLGGVRIEDMVELTENGCRPLPSATKELIEL